VKITIEVTEHVINRVQIRTLREECLPGIYGRLAVGFFVDWRRRKSSLNVHCPARASLVLRALGKVEVTDCRPRDLAFSDLPNIQ
jgi:hypothetical protein